MERQELPLRGRGASNNPPNRFDRITYEVLPEAIDPDEPAPTTQFLQDTSRSVITYNESPDIGFHASVNPYRGCEHGCCYCYARPFHEYLGFSAGLDFETKIMVKEDAPQLLRRELSSSKWKPQTLAFSGVTDSYQPIERRLQITRRCLEVLAEFRNPVVIVTKNHLVTRDIDLLSELAKYNAAAVFLSITTLDPELARLMEPRASHPQGRLNAIEELARAGVKVGTLVAPMIPGLNDHEIPSIVAAAGRVGARYATYIPVRLPMVVAPLFAQWLETHYPDRKEKVLGRIRSMRGGKLNDPRFGSRMTGEGVFADMMGQFFALACRKARIQDKGPDLSADAFRRYGAQRLLFE